MKSVRVETEFERLHTALNDARNDERRSELYAAQQALAWVIDPDAIRSPYNTIMGIAAGSGDYSAPRHPPPSSGTCDRCATPQ